MPISGAQQAFATGAGAIPVVGPILVALSKLPAFSGGPPNTIVILEWASIVAQNPAAALLPVKPGQPGTSGPANAWADLLCWAGDSSEFAAYVAANPGDSDVRSRGNCSVGSDVKAQAQQIVTTLRQNFPVLSGGAISGTPNSSLPTPLPTNSESTVPLSNSNLPVPSAAQTLSAITGQIFTTPAGGVAGTSAGMLVAIVLGGVLLLWLIIRK